MQSEEFIASWNRRRRLQILCSLLSVVCIAAVVYVVGYSGVAEDAEKPLWGRLVVIGGILGVILGIVVSLTNSRCPNCGAFKGSGIFGAPRCTKCNMP